MLPASHRLTTSVGFTEAVRAGNRAGSRTLVLHLRRATAPMVSGGRPVRVGFVVSRAVGGAVVRNRVRRRLRHLARARLALLPQDALLVVRALPAAASAGYADLGADLDRGLRRLQVTPTSGRAS